MKTLFVAAIISVVTADIPTSTTSTIKDRNNSSTYIKNFTGSTIEVSISTTEKLVNTTESTNVLLSRKNGTITRQGKLTEVQNINTSKAIQSRSHQDSNENKNYIDQDEKKLLQIEFVTKQPETNRNILKNIFEKMLSYENIQIEKTYKNIFKNEKEKIIKAYLLLVAQKYKRKWIPNNIGVKLLPVKNVTVKGRSTHKRQKRSIKEDAGFTHDANTCKQYNSNLITLWSNLSKYIGTSEKSPPNKSVLHNIGIMIKAYLDHVTPIEVNTEAATEKLIIRKERNNPVVKEIKTNLDVNKINEVNALTDFILDQVNNIRIDNIKEECNKIIQNQIATLMNMAFKKYLLYNCNNIYNNAHSNVNVNILNSMPLNNQGLNGNLQHSSIPKIEEVSFDHNLPKVIKRSIETATNIDKSTHNDLLTEKDSLNSSISNNITKNETLNSSNEKQQQNSFESRRALQLNGRYCADLALDQFILTVKLILRLYLLNDDCTSGASKFIIISKLIEATPILEPFNENNLDYLSKYRVLLKLLDNMETEDMTNLFSTPKADVLQNKNTLEEFLHDVNNLAVSINYKQREKNNIANNGDDSKQQLLNSLYNYQQLAYNRNDGLLNPKNAIPFSVNVGYNAIVPNNPINKINKNLKEFQGMYTGVPINQNIEANRSVIYAKTNIFYDTKPNTNGATINSGNKFELNLDKTAPKNLNNYLSTPNSKSEVIPATIFSASEKENSILNPIQYKLIMNYSETFPTSLKGNLASLSSFAAFPYLNVLNSTSINMNPLENTLLNQNLASNPITLYNYFSKFAKNNNPENQLKISPPVPNKIDAMNLLNANNNKVALNSNFNTKSELTINESNVKNYLRNPALVQQNSNTPSFGVNSGVHYYNLINNALTNNMNSNLINNLKSLRDNNLVKDKILKPFNVNSLHFMKPNTLRSNLNLDDHKNTLQSNNFVRKLVIKNPLRTLNIPQIQKTPIISTTDLMPNSSNGSFINRPLKVINSSYIRTQPIKAISGVPLKNIQSIEKTNQGLSKSLFINPYSYSAKVINKENEIEKYLNLENVPVLRSNLLRNQKLETKPSTIVAIDNLPIISSDPDANGDVELTYVFHHPQIVIYQPQVLVKRRISYIDYINNFNKIFNNQKKNQQQLDLYKIIKYLPHNNVQVLYQSDSLLPILRIDNTTSSN